MPAHNCCPKCAAELSLQEIIALMFGDGFVRNVVVELPDRRRVPMDARLVNPDTMKVVTPAVSATRGGL
jgi:hypothetical protein